MACSIDDLKILLHSIKQARKQWIKKKTQESFLRLLALYSCLGEDIEYYEKYYLESAVSDSPHSKTDKLFRHYLIQAMQASEFNPSQQKEYIHSTLRTTTSP